MGAVPQSAIEGMQSAAGEVAEIASMMSEGLNGSTGFELDREFTELESADPMSEQSFPDADNILMNDDAIAEGEDVRPED